jgi:hypothetical protein
MTDRQKWEKRIQKDRHNKKTLAGEEQAEEEEEEEEEDQHE